MKRWTALALTVLLLLSFAFAETTKKAPKGKNKQTATESKNGDDKQPYISLYKNGSRDEKKIAITIDDWWRPEKLPAFLDLAAEYDCKLTLYPVGVNLHKKDREMWQRALDEGHEIGNHTNTHVDLKNRSKESITQQLTKMEKKLHEVLGHEYPINTVRYPFGSGRHYSRRSAFARTVREAGYMHVALWDVDTTDPNKLLKSIQNGSIVLLHGNPKDFRCLKKVLPQLQADGWEMVTVSELLGITKTTPEPSYEKKAEK